MGSISMSKNGAGEVLVRIEGELDAITSVDVRRELDLLIGDPPQEGRAGSVGVADDRQLRGRSMGLALQAGACPRGLRDQPLAITRLLRLDRVR
jgi:hypothetical protein